MNMTEKLYDYDSYLTEFDAEVLSCEKTSEGYGIVLDRTCFFPEEGGQTSDQGYLNQVRIKDVQMKDGVITHYADEMLEEGTPVHGKVDFAERFSNMQQHSAEHVMSGLIYANYGFENVGFHLSPQTVTMDVGGYLTDEQLEEIVLKANRVIYENVDITACYPEKEELAKMRYRSKKEIDGPVRIVTIEGYDACACCAPHVSKTGEIGCIKIVKSEKYKGGVRLTILAGMRALQDTLEKQKLLDRVSRDYSTNPAKLEETMARMQEETKMLKEKLAEINGRLVEQKASAIAPQDDAVILFEDELDSTAHRKYVNLLLEKCTGVIGVFAGEEGNYRYIMASNTRDMKQVNQLLREKLQAKGGGNEKMIQGTVNAGKGELEEVLRAL